MNNIIPPITDPLGDYWDQPESKYIAISDDFAVMEKHVLEQLKAYNTSFPSGVYSGKMWRTAYSECESGWLLRWFGNHENPKLCSCEQREIILICQDH